MPSKHGQYREHAEIPLAHDAATWDEEEIDSGWDDEKELLVGELARSASAFQGN
ncbi:MAG TPA: hypothetical protein VMU46_12070 [Burkholderiales bacterium]|nr:hypothetical protein [Burkholderiales bacterium]